MWLYKERRERNLHTSSYVAAMQCHLLPLLAHSSLSMRYCSCLYCSSLKIVILGSFYTPSLKSHKWVWFTSSLGLCSLEFNIDWERNVWSSIKIKALIDQSSIIIGEKKTEEATEPPAAHKGTIGSSVAQLLEVPPEDILKESSRNSWNGQNQKEEGGGLQCLIISFHILCIW